MREKLAGYMDEGKERACQGWLNKLCQHFLIPKRHYRLILKDSQNNIYDRSIYCCTVLSWGCNHLTVLFNLMGAVL